MTKLQKDFLSFYKKNNKDYKNHKTLLSLPVKNLREYVLKNKNEIMEYVTDSIISAMKHKNKSVYLFKFDDTGFSIFLEAHQYTDNLMSNLKYFKKTNNLSYITKINKFFDHLKKKNNLEKIKT